MTTADLRGRLRAWLELLEGNARVILHGDRDADTVRAMLARLPASGPAIQQKLALDGGGKSALPSPLPTREG